jgi:hypothetical protein
VSLVVELRFDPVIWAACSPTALLGFIFCQWIAALDHETLDDSVETRAVVKAGLGKFDEIIDVLGCDFWPEFEGHFTLGSFDDSCFAHKYDFVEMMIT